MHLPRLGLGLDFLTLALTAHQVAMEGPLEDVLQRLSLDASDFLQQLAKGTHEAIVASPLPPEAIDPLRAFAEYQAFESMMRRAADEEDDLGI